MFYIIMEMEPVNNVHRTMIYDTKSVFTFYLGNLLIEIIANIHTCYGLTHSPSGHRFG
jgi:hypothetical protein